MAAFKRSMLEKQDTTDLPPLVESPPTSLTLNTSRYTHRSIETLVVVLAVITIVAVVAGIIARICGGHGENDVEGCVERRCRSCIDSGLPPPAPAEEPKPATSDHQLHN